MKIEIRTSADIAYLTFTDEEDFNGAVNRLHAALRGKGDREVILIGNNKGDYIGFAPTHYVSHAVIKN